MFTSSISHSGSSFNNIAPFFRPSEVRDRMYEAWNRREKEELDSLYDNMEDEHNPFREEDLNSIPNAY